MDDLQRAAAANADAVLRRFFDLHGRLLTLPAKQSRQLAVYDLVVQRFVPGVRYTELEVNRELMAVFDDYVTLRRGLIDFGLMDRADGQYWRSGGTVPITAPAPAPGPKPATPAAPPRVAPSSRGAARREAILTAAAQLFAERGYAAVGMDDIGAAAGVTGPAIYRHFGAKATVLTAVFDRVIDAVTDPYPVGEAAEADTENPADPAARLRELITTYASAVAGRRRLLAVFIREVHHLPAADRTQLVQRQRVLVGRWRALLAGAHADWDGERVRTAVHAAFGMLNAVGTFESPLTDRDLARQLGNLAAAALAVEPDVPVEVYADPRISNSANSPTTSNPSAW